MISLVNGHIQTAQSVNVTPLGWMEMNLNVDATVIASPFGQVMAAVVFKIYFDANSNVITTNNQNQIWSNLELNPQQSPSLLGTWYLVNFYDQNGARVNQNPQQWQFPNTAGSTVDIGSMTAFNNGGIIYYPVPLGGGSNPEGTSAPAMLGNWEGSNLLFSPTTQGQFSNTTAFRVQAFMVKVQNPFSINTLRMTVGGNPANFVGVGLYDQTKTLVVAWNNIATVNSATRTAASPAGGPVTIQPGFFFWAFASNVTVGIATNGSLVNSKSNENGQPWNWTTVRGGYAANVMSGAGVMPGTLGVITAGYPNNDGDLPVWIIEP